MAFIYALICPNSGGIRYVGKSNDPASRLRGHINEARRRKSNQRSQEWIRTLLDLDLEPQIQLLACVLPGSKWQEVERACIAQCLEDDCNLTNATAGGEGFQFLSEADRQVAIEAMKSAWADPKVRKNHIDAMRSAWKNPVAIANKTRSANQPSTKAKKSAAIRATHANPEVRKKISDATNARWADPEKYKHYAAINRARIFNETPEQRAARGAAIKASWILRKQRKEAACLSTTPATCRPRSTSRTSAAASCSAARSSARPTSTPTT